MSQNISTAKQFILIAGAPRSGTTLLSNMLSAHPDIYCFPQTQFFNKIWGGRHIYNFKKNRKKMLVVISRDTAVQRSGMDLLHVQGSFRNRFDNYYQEYIDLVNDYNFDRKQYIGDKSPRHTMLIKEIMSNLPVPLKVIAIVRDSRAVLASMKARNLIRNVASGAAIWNAYSKHIARLNNYCPPDKMVLLKYENLVNDPQEHARQITAMLGIPYSDKMIQINSNNSSYTQHAGQGIFNNSLATWQGKLSSEEIDVITVMTKKYLNRFEYAAEGGKGRIPLRAKTAYWSSAAEEVLLNTLIKLGCFPGAFLNDALKPFLGRP